MPESSEPTTDLLDTTLSSVGPARCRLGPCRDAGFDSGPAPHPVPPAQRIGELLGGLDTGAHVVEVTAEAGIGKTGLLAGIVRLAEAREIRLFSGDAPPDGALLPFGAIVDDADRRPGDIGLGCSGGIDHRTGDAVHALLEPYLEAGGPLVVVLDVPPVPPVGPEEWGGPSVATRPRRGRRRTGRTVPSALTNRERQVAELAGDGLTNREIAAALFVTEKTVEMHLTHVFAKLDVRNRVGLARRLHAAGE